jgi:hypothetical protein
MCTVRQNGVAGQTKSPSSESSSYTIKPRRKGALCQKISSKNVTGPLKPSPISGYARPPRFALIQVEYPWEAAEIDEHTTKADEQIK